MNGENTCFYCEIKLTDKTKTIDHIIPKSKKSTNKSDNKVFCCNYCNQDKGSKSLEEWLLDLQQTPYYHSRRIKNIKKILKI
jgi:CRISPR/Cas system Type II protein with McrA/HNH and RuvC-like nuclease domain